MWRLGVDEGAELVVDGRAATLPQGDGFFLGACLFDHVKPEMRIYREEIFGPVLGVVRANNFETALELVNEHEFGNGTPSSRAMAIRRATLRSGCRRGWSASTCRSRCRWRSTASAAGSASLFGDHAVHGPEGVRFYTRIKTVTCRWPTGIRAGVDTSMPTLG